MLNLNRATILGNATRDVDFRTTPNGHSVASFAVATNRRYKGQDGELKDEVQFHEVVAWSRLAEIAQQIVKRGTKIYVEGRLQTRTWEGQDGAKRQRTEIIAENIIVLSPRGETAVDSADYASAEPAKPKTDTKKAPVKDTAKPVKETPTEDEINLDDIPF